MAILGNRTLKLLLLFAILALPLQAAAQASEYQVKAAFLYNFAKFVEWPAKALKAGDPFRVCVLGEDSFSGALQLALDGKMMREHPASIAHSTELKDVLGCQIVFVSKSEKHNLRAIFTTLQAHGVLTVGETDGFAAEGGVVGFRLEDGKVRLEINLQAAEQQQLQVSSKLLSLAQIVKK